MNPFSNILNSPRTSIAGLLIGIVTIANVLSHQGITLGAAGSGSVISLVSGLAAALLGLLAKDPANSADPAHSTNSTSTAKLGALMLCALLITGTMPLTSSTGRRPSKARLLLSIRRPAFLIRPPRPSSLRPRLALTRPPTC
jgi:hypothetical protein